MSQSLIERVDHNERTLLTTPTRRGSAVMGASDEEAIRRSALQVLRARSALSRVLEIGRSALEELNRSAAVIERVDGRTPPTKQQNEPHSRDDAEDQGEQRTLTHGGDAGHQRGGWKHASRL